MSQPPTVEFNKSDLKAALENSTLGLPPDEELPGDDAPIRYFLIGDDAFPLREWMMKPYSSRNLTNAERIFNYRLVRAIDALWRMLSGFLPIDSAASSPVSSPFLNRSQRL